MLFIKFLLFRSIQYDHSQVILIDLLRSFSTAQLNLKIQKDACKQSSKRNIHCNDVEFPLDMSHQFGSTT
jgi:hypothetical protein